MSDHQKLSVNRVGQIKILRQDILRNENMSSTVSENFHNSVTFEFDRQKGIISFNCSHERN